jgi:hypothetical protein
MDAAETKALCRHVSTARRPSLAADVSTTDPANKRSYDLHA